MKLFGLSNKKEMSLQNWESKKFPDASILSGKYCRLELLDYKHIDELFDCLSVPNRLEERYSYLPYGPFQKCDFIVWFKSMITNDALRTYVVINSKTNAIGGQLSLMNVVPAMGVMEIGHVHFSPLISKSVVATEAVYLCLRYIFDELEYRRCEWKCDHANKPSALAALRFGFSFEGIFRQHLVIKGKNRDTGWYAMLDFQWKQCIRRGYEEYLDISNFDTADGKLEQRLKLSDCIGLIPAEI